MISSKEIIKKVGISRATLNNYIKMGIIPKPVVKRQNESDKRSKKLGYFPESVLDTIKRVKILKEKGYSMDEISGIIIEKDNKSQEKNHEFNLSLVKVLSNMPSQSKVTNSEKQTENKIYGEELKLNFNEMQYPAYLVDHDLNVTWINPVAERSIFRQKISNIDEDSRNIFKLIFNWGFDCDVKNWSDLIAYHMSFVKSKFNKTEILRLYEGISTREIDILEDIYDKTLTYPDLFISDVTIKFIKNDSSTNKYQIYSLSSKEGILYVYIPS